jgi:hypothetical protein
MLLGRFRRLSITPSIQTNGSLSTSELARLLGSTKSTDLQAIDELPLSERQWLESETRRTDKRWRRRLLGGVQLKQQFLRKPYYARSHLTDLQSWVNIAAGQPVAMGWAD